MQEHTWLENEEQFEAFRARMADRLRQQRNARIGFLQRAVGTVDELTAEARALRDEASVAQLAACRAAAAAELETLEHGAAPAPRPEPADGCAELEGDAHCHERPAAWPTGLEAAPEAPPAAAAAPAAIVAPLSQAESPTAQGEGIPEQWGDGPASNGAVLERAGPGAPANLSPPAVETAPAPEWETSHWTPRDRSIVESEVAELAALIHETAGAGETELLRLKAAACRLRRTYQELDAHGAYPGDVKAARGALLARIRDEYGDPYVPPLDTNLVPADPTQWEELARAYEGLLPAVEAFAWFGEHAGELKRAEAEELLEGIGAAQQRLFRRLEGVFRAGDDQQRRLYVDLRDSAEALSIFLDSLRPATSDAELARLAGRLEKTYRDLSGNVAKRLAQTTALSALHALLDEPSFGTREDDAERLQAVAGACLDAGVPKTKPELRNTMLEWEALLEDAPGLEALRAEIAKEKERQARRGRAVPDDEEGRGGKRLAAGVEKLRQELLPLTHGKRCLFVGGHVHEEHRQRIQEALELESLEWPEIDRFDTNPNEFAAEVRRSDIVVLLIRFMRTGMNKVSQLAREQGKAVVRLPRGLNVARVITNFHEQLVPRGTAR